MRDPLEDAWLEWTRGQDDHDPRRKIAFRAGYEAREGQTVLRSEYDNAVDVANAEKRGKTRMAFILEKLLFEMGDPQHPKLRQGTAAVSRLETLVGLASQTEAEVDTLMEEHDREVARRALVKYAGDNFPGVHPGSIDKWLDKDRA